MLLRRTRRDLAELAGLVWLALEIVRFVQWRVERGRMTGAGSLTWLGHSCAVIQIDGHVFVTDPVLRKRIFHLRRKEPVDPAALDGIDAILLSHSHHDHLDLRSLDRLDPGTQVLVPTGAGGLLRRRGFRFVREVVPGDDV